ncbi:MAG: DMT family transporter [Pseudomonadota bacterium]|nr:hypothetical protein [Pseudomonadales bacterium]MDY6920967.1 DMT family transporter [Pseudomonadota bacterium]
MLEQIPSYLLPVFSALLWALSAPLINQGVRGLPAAMGRSGILLGLFVSCWSGALCLSAFVWLNGIPFAFNGALFLAGILTFPLATATYYLASISFKNHTEIASQFAKSKPLITLPIAYLLLGEPVEQGLWLSIPLIVVGVGIFLVQSMRGDTALKPVVFGLLAAVFWALGEIFMKLGLTENSPLADTYAALLSGALGISCYLPFFLGPVIQQRSAIGTWLWPFCAHGIISFGFAYVFFFSSLAEYGVMKTVVINSFWPVLALVITALINRLRRLPNEVPVYVWWAGLFLCSGSALQFVYLL